MERRQGFQLRLPLALWSGSLALFSKEAEDQKNALDIGHLVMVWGGMGLILVWNHNT